MHGVIKLCCNWINIKECIYGYYVSYRELTNVREKQLGLPKDPQNLSTSFLGFFRMYLKSIRACLFRLLSGICQPEAKTNSPVVELAFEKLKS